MGAHCEHDVKDRTGLAGRALELALEDADRRCAAVGERMTAPRRRVLGLLLEADGPLKAYDLISGFGRNGETAKPPTVYRALEFLERAGFAHRIESLNAFVACRRVDETHSAAFLICDCCGAAVEIDPPGDHAMRLAADQAGYALRSVTVEARGSCSACRKSTSGITAS